ncbi:MAG: hypothetical protein IKZ90_02865 [Clostridiales bacterium]|nr:hypothetical protein [Clostridiales bacterium]
MRTLLILLRTEFISLVNSLNRKGKTPFIIAAIGLAILGLFMIGMFAIIGGSTTYLLVEKDLAEYAIFISLSLSMIIALMFGVINSTRDARSSDTGMLLAMPIPKASIVISKLLGMYLLDVLCAMVMLVPSFLIVCTVGGASSALFFRGIAIGFLIPALPLFISLLISAMISFLRRATKFGQVATIILTMGTLLLYMVVVPNISSYAEELNITTAESITKMKQILPFYWITEAIYSGDLVCVLLTLLITVIPLILAVYIHTRGLNGTDFHVDNSKKARNYKGSSFKKAVLSMELRRYFSSTNYIMNTLFGTILLIAAVAYIAYKGVGDISFLESIEVDGETVDLLSKFNGLTWAAIWAAMINFFASVTYTTPSSVSIEGKRIWLNKSLPIPTKIILFSKLMVSVLIFQPVSIIACIVLSIVSNAGIVPCLLLIVLTSLFHLLCSFVGLIFGLIFARLDWTNEAEVIKKGMAIILTMVINMILAILSGIGLIIAVIITRDAVTYGVFAGEIVLIAGLCAGAYAIITHYGVRKYETLNG